MKSLSIEFKICIYLFLIFYLKPFNVSLIPLLDAIYKLGKLTLTLIILCMFILRKKRISINLLLCISFILIWAISTYFNTGSLGENAQVLLSIIGLVVFFECFKNMPIAIDTIFEALYNISVCYILLNLLTIIIDKPLFADAIVSYEKYFLGSDNYYAFILLPLSGILFAHDFRLFSRIRSITWFWAIIGLLNLVLVVAYTGILAYLLFLFLVLFRNNKYLNKFFSVKVILVLMVLFLVAVVRFNLVYYLKDVLALIGKKGFSSREIIWPAVFNAFSSKWLLGYGVLTENQVNSYLLYGANHAHNFILELLLDTGVVGSIIMFVWIYKILKKDKYVQLNKDNKVLIQCFVALLVCSFFDFYINLIYFYLLLQLMLVTKNGTSKVRNATKTNLVNSIVRVKTF